MNFFQDSGGEKTRQRGKLVGSIQKGERSSAFTGQWPNENLQQKIELPIWCFFADVVFPHEAFCFTRNKQTTAKEWHHKVEYLCILHNADKMPSSPSSVAGAGGGGGARPRLRDGGPAPPSNL